MSEQCDVIILGTGAAGLTAALAATHEGASVRIFEKSELIGGTTAMSGESFGFQIIIYKRDPA